MEKIFSEFDSITAKAWKQKIQVDLKGADYNKTLVSQTNEGITIKPFYHNDSYKKLEIPKVEAEIEICQTIFVDNVKKANGIAKEVLQKGATTIRFIATDKFDYKTLLESVEATEIIVVCEFLKPEFTQKLISYASKKHKLKIVIDVINNLAKNGNWYSGTRKEEFERLKILVEANKKETLIGVDASLYQNAGATTVQQLAYTLAHLNEYLNEGIIKTKTEVKITFSVGSDYFFEIAKIRAFRYLAQKLVTEYNLKVLPKILVEPTKRNKTIYDYNVNMLRTTTECMSAIIGGADTVSNTAYDSVYHRANEFGARIARNQLLVLTEESYFKNNKEIAKGAYYIEQITYEIAEKSLELFKEIEKKGGFLKQLEEGTIQRKIEETAKKEQEQFDAGELVLLGTNKYPNKKDKMKLDLELYPFVKIKPRKTIIRPIVSKRLAEKLEQERLNLE